MHNLHVRVRKLLRSVSSNKREKMLIIQRTHEFSFTPAQNPRCCENLILKLSENFLSNYETVDKHVNDPSILGCLMTLGI